MANFTNWFNTFLEEKELPSTEWELKSPSGETHFISSDVVIEHIKIASEQEQANIKEIIVKIDFHNGDVNHFFQHLAQALVNNY